MPILSDLETPLTEGLNRYLENHIVAGREHKNAREASFLHSECDEPPISEIFGNLLKNSSKEFVSFSQEAAKRLFAAMEKDRRISPGDLVACTFREYSSPDLWLALLKMDPTKGFASRQQWKGGLLQVLFEPVEDVLPTGELQKCAFIQPPGPGEESVSNLIVLDQQLARYGARRQTASFFTKDFLQCEIGLNREDKTNAFVYGSREFALRKEEEWTEDVIERFHRDLELHVQEPQVDVEDFARQSVPASDRDDYLTYLKERRQLVDFVFTPDDGRARRLTEYAWYEGVNGLKVRIDPNHIGPNDTLHHTYDSSLGTHVVTIRTIMWRKKVR